MAESDNGTENDITDPVREEHGDVRRRFVELWNLRTSGDAGAVALDAAWQPIANLLDGHPSADATAAHQYLPTPDNSEVTEHDSANSPKRTSNTHPPQ